VCLAGAIKPVVADLDELMGLTFGRNSYRSHPAALSHASAIVPEGFLA
jgi:hypothetical protein